MTGDEERERTPIGPAVPVPGGDEEKLAEECTHRREELSPKQTADCAGAAMIERYENEEDGGS